MKAAITIAIFSLAAFFSECGFGKNLYKPYRTKNYELSNSHIESNLYRTKDGNLRRLPFLPSGLFVFCRKNELPVLDYQKRIEDVGAYPIHDIIAIYSKDECIIAVTKNQAAKIIDSGNPYHVEATDIFETAGASLVFDTSDVDLQFFGGYVQNALAIQDRRINKKYHVDFSTPIVNGILKIGLYDDAFYFGETLYSYFVLDLHADEVMYFKDKNQYYDFCKENILHCVEMLESDYLVTLPWTEEARKEAARRRNK